MPADARVEADKVTWASQSSSGFLQQLDVAPTEVDAIMILAGQKMKFWNNYYPATSVQRINSACRAKPVLIFNQPCADFVRKISAYTERLGAS